LCPPQIQVSTSPTNNALKSDLMAFLPPFLIIYIVAVSTNRLRNPATPIFMHPADCAKAFVYPPILNLGARILSRQHPKGNFIGCFSLFQEQILIQYRLLLK
jgi:hypothetical protein